MTKTNQIDSGIPYKSSQEIRQDYIDFFIDRGHKFVKSSSVAPTDDPTIMFTNAGMNQFKSIFLGEEASKVKRAANSQKCLRVSGKHNDLEEVGSDGTHHTFFEMLGNWSFGDYYKKEAITWAWELLTKVWKLPKERLFVTVHTSDDEAKELWLNCTDISPERVLKFGQDNFWEMGAVGPCGPCSEIHFDKGELETQQDTFKDPKEGVNGENDRYVEIWNLVFMQSERLQDGSLKPLKKQHVDTGMGLERVCAIIQNKDYNYDTDLFSPIISKIAKESAVAYSSGPQGMPHRVIADHLRAVVFAITDGVTPANEGRGYVIRRILRRASRFAHKIGFREPFLYKLVATLAEIMKEPFPEITQRQAYVEEVIGAEEKRFLKTLDQGLTRLDKLTSQLVKKKSQVVKGEDVFLFHDTYGFPVDLTRVIVSEKALEIDEEGYTRCMKEQKDRARKAMKFSHDFLSEENWTIFTTGRSTEFIGYDNLSAELKTLRFREDGDNIYLVFDKTPFYVESGGQIGDVGTLENKDLALKVVDTFQVVDLTIHKCTLVQGLLKKETMKSFTGLVSDDHRQPTRCNHSATHLLHAALRSVLGDHVAQQGSYVGPDRLRFDFTHHRSVTKEDIRKIETIVNEQILQNYPVETKVCSFDDAKKQGAMALFGEKYGDTVRVLTMGDFSKELCGGTHVRSTGDIGLFTITEETAIAAGVRRIEAFTGRGALAKVQFEADLVDQLSRSWKAPVHEIINRSKSMSEHLKELEKKLSILELKELNRYVDNLLSQNKVKWGEFFYVVCLCDDKVIAKKDLQRLLDLLQGKLQNGIALVVYEDTADLSALVAVGSKALGPFNANNIIKELNKVTGGRGGGRPDKARAGIKDTSKKETLVNTFPSVLKALEK